MEENREWKNGKPGKSECQKRKSLLLIQYILKHADTGFCQHRRVSCSFDLMCSNKAFIGKPLKIQIFDTKNTPVHWSKIHPIKQEYSLVQRKKFIGMKSRF